MQIKPIEVYFNQDGWAYPGVYQEIGNLPVVNHNEKVWTLFGALVLDLLKSKNYHVIIYHDSRLVDEWYEQVEFESRLSQKIAARLKNDHTKAFLSFELEKLDSRTVRNEIERLKLV